MMAVCSFLGHRHIYGHDVQLRLQAAVNHLVEENDSVEFLLYLWKSTEPFYALCLLAALRAKQCAPQKVTLTLVADRLELEQRLADKWTHPLFFIADRLLPLSVSKDRNPLKVLKRTVQWMVKQSTHVINGFYEDLFDRDDFVLNFARNAEFRSSMSQHQSWSGLSLPVLSNYPSGNVLFFKCESQDTHRKRLQCTSI